jgi:hypothetical protein
VTKVSTTTVHRSETGADRFMRRLLRVGDDVDRNAILGARRNTTVALMISGIRCTITYLLIPILAPVLGFLEVFGPPLTITLSFVAIGMGISGVRRFWMADHKHRWAYTGFIALVNVLLLIGIGFEIQSLIL